VHDLSDHHPSEWIIHPTRPRRAGGLGRLARRGPAQALAASLAGLAPRLAGPRPRPRAPGAAARRRDGPLEALKFNFFAGGGTASVLRQLELQVELFAVLPAESATSS